MASEEHQDLVCAFVREIIASRVGESVRLTGRPDRGTHDTQAVDELWDSPTHRFAVEHTQIESFDRQLANLARIERLLVPVKEALAGRLPGRFALAVSEADTSAARVNFEHAHVEIERLILNAVDSLGEGETVTLRSPALPFELRLHLRFRNDSQLIIYSDVDGDPDERRRGRMRRALAGKCPKLAVAAADGRTSVLILEADDIQHSNATVVYAAFRDVLPEQPQARDIVVLVETDGTPWAGWILKEGAAMGNAVRPRHGGGYLYQRGKVL